MPLGNLLAGRANLCVHLDDKTLTVHPPYLDAAYRKPADETPHTETAHS